MARIILNASTAFENDLFEKLKNPLIFLFASAFHRHYTDRGIRKILMRYIRLAGIDRSISSHKLRHFLFTWLKNENIDDAFIQPIQDILNEIPLKFNPN